MSDITDAQILQALRAKAALYTRLANEFERELGPVRVASLVDLPALQDYLKTKGGRPADLAKHFGVNEATIKDLVKQPGSGIQTVARGWLKLEDDFFATNASAPTQEAA